MALHGDISINGQLLGTWEAVRQQELKDVDQVSDYICKVWWRAPTYNFAFTVAHRYSDGAEELTALVLKKARRLRLLEEGR